mgnify:FL=1
MTCELCDRPGKWEIGLIKEKALFLLSSAGHACEIHVLELLQIIEQQTKGKPYFPAIAENGIVIFHGYRDAISKGLTIAQAWEAHLKQN